MRLHQQICLDLEVTLQVQGLEYRFRIGHITRSLQVPELTGFEGFAVSDGAPRNLTPIGISGHYRCYRSRDAELYVRSNTESVRFDVTDEHQDFHELFSGCLSGCLTLLVNKTIRACIRPTINHHDIRDMQRRILKLQENYVGR
jgi:hypothetical protein